MSEEFPQSDLDLDKIIYPHSALVSEPVAAKDTYEEFKGSKFIIYISIYSDLPDKNYTVNSAIIDMYEKVETSMRTAKFESLEGQEYKDYINSINWIFESYNKHILNFPAGETYSLKEYLSLVNDWVGDEVNIPKEEDIKS